MSSNSKTVEEFNPRRKQRPPTDCEATTKPVGDADEAELVSFPFRTTEQILYCRAQGHNRFKNSIEGPEEGQMDREVWWPQKYLEGNVASMGPDVNWKNKSKKEQNVSF